MSIIDFQTRNIHKLLIPQITGTPNTVDESVLPDKGAVVYDDTNKELLIGDGENWYGAGTSNSSGELVTTIAGAATIPITIYWNKVGNSVTLQWRDLNALTTTPGQALETTTALPDILKPATDPYLIRYLQWPTMITNGAQNTTDNGIVIIDFLDMLIQWQPFPAGNFTGAWAGVKGSTVTYQVSI